MIFIMRSVSNKTLDLGVAL